MITEDIKLKQWTHNGLKCFIASAPTGSAVNGYVQFPDGHPLSGLSYNAMPFNAHGGLTYANGSEIGFDTIHAGDHWDREELVKAGIAEDGLDRYGLIERHHFHDSMCLHWNKTSLISEVNSLADQVAQWTTKFNDSPLVGFGDIWIPREHFVKLSPSLRERTFELVSEYEDFKTDLSAALKNF